MSLVGPPIILGYRLDSDSIVNRRPNPLFTAQIPTLCIGTSETIDDSCFDVDTACRALQSRSKNPPEMRALSA